MYSTSDTHDICSVRNPIESLKLRHKSKFFHHVYYGGNGLFFAILAATISPVINLYSKKNDDPLLSIDKVLSMSSCYRNSICRKGRIISWTFELFVSSCLIPNGSCSLHVNDIICTCLHIRASHMHAVRSPFSLLRLDDQIT